MSSKTFSLFVRHPAGIDTEIIEELLKKCGLFKAWRPQRDPSTGNAKNFGFADFEDMASLARALRLIEPIHLPDKSEVGGFKQMLTKADKGTQALLDVYNSSNIVNVQEDNEIRESISEFLREKFGASVMDSASAFLNSLLGEGAVKEAVPEPASSKDSHESPELVNKANMIDLEEESRRYEMQRAQDLKRAFEERVSKWEAREIYHHKVHAEQAEKDKQFRESLELSRESMREYLAAYDDDEEDKKGEDEWYTDRDRWIEKRKASRLKEQQFDEKDRKMEAAALARANKSSAQTPSSNYRRSEQKPVVPAEESAELSSAALSEGMAQLLKTTLAFLLPESNTTADTLFQHEIDWSLLTREVISKKITPIVDQKITQLLGESEPDLVEFIIDTVLPVSISRDGEQVMPEQGKDPHDIMAEVGAAFGDSEEEKAEAESLMVAVWRAVIWEIEKTKYASGRKLAQGLTIEDVDMPKV